MKILKENLIQNKNFSMLLKTLDRNKEFFDNKIPLCAAETFTSPFVRLILSSEFEGQYIMGSLINNKTADFIGSENLLNLYEILNDICKTKFQCKFADARTLSGMNCITTVLMALTEFKDTIMLSMPDCGGHSSVPLIAERLGLNVIPFPYNYLKQDFDYDEANELLSKNKVKFVLVCLSDLLFPPKIEKLVLPKNTGLLYDATQTLGLIGSNLHNSPLNIHRRCVLIGGTHKTLPGPTCGLVMCNYDEYIEKLDRKINPDFLRNVQINIIISVILSFIEQDFIGLEYQKNILKTANVLGSFLEKDFSVGKRDGIYSDTHQLFLYTSEQDMDIIYKGCLLNDITLNKKKKKLFGGFGLRIGVQDIARYNWSEYELNLISILISNIKNYKSVDEILKMLIPLKKPFYILDSEDKIFNNYL